MQASRIESGQGPDQAAARNSRPTARMAEALASMSIAVVIADAHGRIEYANDAFTRLTGRSPGAHPPHSLTEVVTSGGDLRLAAVLGGAAGGTGGFSGDLRLTRADGSVVPCGITVSSIARPDGGTDGVIVTFVDLTARRAEEEILYAAIRRLEEQSSRDFLTGLFNRFYLFEVLDRERARALRYGQSLAILMVDLDDFKRVNDGHGHDAGDAVLREVADALKTGLREGDVLARYGGDEFCVLLPNADGVAGSQVAERMRSQVAALRVGPSLDLSVTASVGIATTSDTQGGAPDAILRLADDALLRAKRAGGDRVELYSAGAGTATSHA